MTDLLKEGSAWLEQERTAHCSGQVSYFVGTTENVVNATFGRTEFEMTDDAGQLVVSHVRDFLILAADLGADPELGDKIVTGDMQYEVMPFGPDRNGWRWSDQFRQTYRIHTRCTGFYEAW